MKRNEITDKNLIKMLTGSEKAIGGSLIGLVLLFVISAIEILLSVAIYASTTIHKMSFVNYLYGDGDNYYDHGVLKFFLFLQGSVAIILLVIAFVSGLIYLLRKGRIIWAGSLLSFVLTVFLVLFVPVNHKEKVYAIKATVKTDSPIKFINIQTFTTRDFSSKAAAKHYFSTLDFNECFNQEIIAKTKEVHQPLLKFRLPENPKPTNSESELDNDY